MPTVIIYWSQGRSREQKSTVIEEITDVLVKHGSARREDVLVIFQEIFPGNSGRAGRLIEPPVLQHDRNSGDDGANSPGEDG
jgi:4-oxalocrotonate tautomerase family enzyme